MTTDVAITGGEALVRAAAANGVTTLFALPGAQIYPLFDALHGSSIDVIVPRHEQAAGYMAMGYAKSTGTAGAFAVVPGPGVLNASAALCTAMGTCAPVICLTGQVPSEYLGQGRGHLHELADQAGTLRTLIKDALHIAESRETSSMVNRAFHLCRSHRPGPVSVEMCWDTMAARAVVPFEPPLLGTAAPEPNLDEIRAAVKLIQAARRPLIMCGAGAQHAAAEVRALAELLNAPVTAFRSGRGVVSEDHPLGVAAVAARELWDDVDLLIGIGSRLEMPYMRWRDPMRYERRPAASPRLLRIDIDPAEMSRLVPDVGVVADAAAACRLIVDRLQPRNGDREAQQAQIGRAKGLAAELLERMQPQTAYLKVLRDVIPRSGFLVPELSQAGFATYTGAYPVLEPRTYVTEGFQGTLGFGYTTALGVKAANRDRAVVSIAGDGGFMFGVQELATAAQYRLGVVVLVFNNGAYGNVLRDQQQQYGGREIGARLANPDFVRLAESFGVAARRVHSPAQLQPVLERALSDDAPALIEVVVPEGSEASPWPFIHMRARPSLSARG